MVLIQWKPNDGQYLYSLKRSPENRCHQNEYLNRNRFTIIKTCKPGLSGLMDSDLKLKVFADMDYMHVV